MYFCDIRLRFTYISVNCGVYILLFSHTVNNNNLVLFLFVIDTTLIIANIFSQESVQTAEEFDEKLHEISPKSHYHN